MNIAIIGGGNLGHAISGYIKYITKETSVTLVTRRPNEFNGELELNIENSKIVNVKIDVTDDYSIVANSDIIMITVPHFAKVEVLSKIKPYIHKEQTLVAIPAGAGFNILTNGFNCNIYGFQRVPLICRTRIYGKSVDILGIRPTNKIAGISTNINNNNFPSILSSIFGVPFTYLEKFIELTLCNSNPLLHPSRYVTMWKNWKDEVPYSRNSYFYSEWNDEASEMYIKADQDLQSIYTELLPTKNIVGVLEYYESQNKSDLTKKLNSILSLKNILSPMIRTDKGYYPDWNSRYFKEDILYSLLPIIAIGDIVNVSTPTLDYLFEWAVVNANIEIPMQTPFYSDKSLYTKENLLNQ